MQSRFGERLPEGGGNYGEGSVAPDLVLGPGVVETGGWHQKRGGFRKECVGGTGK